MKKLSLDVETYSSADLTKAGVYKYAEAEDFKILLLAYSIDGTEVKVVDLANGERIPDEVITALTDNTVIKWAYNAGFERICLSRHLNVKTYLDPEPWRCSLVWAAYVGLPLPLEGAGAALGLTKQKMTEGKELIRLFCKPAKPSSTKALFPTNPQKDMPEKWKLFKEYNKRDVEVEQEIQKILSKYPVPNIVWQEYITDQHINDRGVLLDMPFVKQAIKIDEHFRTELTEKMKQATNLDNPNSVMQMKEFLAENGLETESLDKKAVTELLETAPAPLAEILKVRQQLAKSSVKKYQAMEDAVCADGRARGLFQFYGANRTGRWAGRLIQVQNLPQNRITDLEQARSLYCTGDIKAIDLLYDNTASVLSQLIRTAFIPKAGHKFIVADFSAIEARVIAWLAGETWRLKAFEAGEDIYCASASRMFGIPVKKNGINGHLRQKGKIAELALGYGGSVGALKAMGALEMGLDEDELQPLVASWREANPKITELWWAVDRAAKTAIKEMTKTKTHGITFTHKDKKLFITLSSGRNLVYVKPEIGSNRFGGECVTYYSVGTNKKWEKTDSYGPKLVENIVQAISRDLLAYAIQKLTEAGHAIVMHIHDEVVIEAPTTADLKNVCSLMSVTPIWAKGLNLSADGFECYFYQKD